MMIRKPDAAVFEDSTTVKVVRTTKEVAVEGGATALQTVSRLWLGMILVVFILSGLGAMISAADSPRALLVLPIIGVAVWLLPRLFRPPVRKDAFEAETEREWVSQLSAQRPACAIVQPQPTLQPVRLKYWTKGVVNKATWLGLVGVGLLFFDRGALGWMTFTGVILVARTVLVLSPLFGTRDCIVADRDSVTVHTLLGSTTVATRDLGDIYVKTFRWRSSWWIRFSTGTGQHLVITGLSPEGRRQLLVPYALLGLDPDGARKLAVKLMTLREQAIGYGVSAGHTAPRVAASPAPSRDDTLSGFDPDAIMARYLAEREQLERASGMPEIGTQRPAPRAFGRKGVARAR
jgi:hypothetical protein